MGLGCVPTLLGLVRAEEEKMICVDIGWILLGLASVLWVIGYYKGIFYSEDN